MLLKWIMYITYIVYSWYMYMEMFYDRAYIFYTWRRISVQYNVCEQIMFFYVMIFTHYFLSNIRYLYFLQLKDLILNGQLECSNDLAVKLASYALQGIMSNGW